MPAPKRIYLDTNVLWSAGWPYPSAELKKVSRQSAGLGIAMVMPLPVEVELEEHWKREYRDALLALGKAHGGLSRLTDRRPLKSTHLQDPGPAVRTYRRAAGRAKRELSLDSAPFPRIGARALFEMASREQSPFQGEGRGFQDAVIYRSVLDHLGSTPDREGALVCRDKAFDTSALRDSERSAGITLKVLKTLSDATALLDAHVAESVLRWAEADQSRARAALENERANIETFLRERLKVDVRDFPFLHFLLLTDLSLGEITRVTTSRWPNSEEGEPVSLTFEADVTLKINVRGFPQDPPAPVGLGEEVTRRAYFAALAPDVKTEEVGKEVQVEARAILDGNEYRQIELLNASLKLDPLEQAIRAVGPLV